MVGGYSRVEGDVSPLDYLSIERELFRPLTSLTTPRPPAWVATIALLLLLENQVAKCYGLKKKLE